MTINITSQTFQGPVSSVETENIIAKTGKATYPMKRLAIVPITISVCVRIDTQDLVEEDGDMLKGCALQ